MPCPDARSLMACFVLSATLCADGGLRRPGESVEYQVELISFEEAPSSYSMSAAEKKVRCSRYCLVALARLIFAGRLVLTQP